MVYAAATRNPTHQWAAQQLRNAMMDSAPPAILLRDRDDKFGTSFDRVAEGAGARVIKTAVRTPNMNAVAERLVGSLRRELLDHVIVLDDRHLGGLVGEYKVYFNEARPHQGISLRVPMGQGSQPDPAKAIEVKSVLGGLHWDYRRAA
jgi:transposase InsO family protein